jgi:hypothetical protein
MQNQKQKKVQLWIKVLLFVKIDIYGRKYSEIKLKVNLAEKNFCAPGLKYFCQN